MKKLFEIEENEKKRILEMHENATKRNYLMEQGTSTSCFLETTDPATISVLSNNNIEVLCERLSKDEEFYLGRNYFKPSGNIVNVYTPNGAIVPSLRGTLKYVADGKGGNKWMYQGGDSKITQPDEKTLTYMKQVGGTPQSVLQELINFASKNGINDVKFNEFMTNFLNSDELAKQGFTNIVNEFNRIYQSRADFEKIKTEILNNDTIANLPKTQS